MTTNRVETRQNNYLVIMDFFSKESSDEYKDYFKTKYFFRIKNLQYLIENNILNRDMYFNE